MLKAAPHLPAELRELTVRRYRTLLAASAYGWPAAAHELNRERLTRLGITAPPQPIYVETTSRQQSTRLEGPPAAARRLGRGRGGRRPPTGRGRAAR